MAEITGTGTSDNLAGTGGADIIDGGKGNDNITGGAGNDHITAGLGDDVVKGGSGEDTLIGDAPGQGMFKTDLLTMAENKQITVTFEFEEAGYRNTLGVYKADPETGEIQQVEVMWANASLQNSGGDLVGGESSFFYDVAEGEQIGFFLVGNGYSQNDFDGLADGSFEFRNPDGTPATVNSTDAQMVHVADDGAETTINGAVYHTAAYGDRASLNSDNIEHTMGYFQGDSGEIQIGFEDLWKGGDRDFDDAIFTVDIGEASVEVLNAHYESELKEATESADVNSSSYMDANDTNDRLEGGADNDLIKGMQGNDLLVGDGAGAEWKLVDGEWVYDASAQAASDGPIRTDDDVLVGDSGRDVLLAGGGDDTLDGGDGMDRLNAGVGNDLADGGRNDDTINLEGGDDIGIGGLGADIVNAGAGNDLVYGDLIEGENLLGNSGATTPTNIAQFTNADASWTAGEHDGKPTMSHEVLTDNGETYTLTFEMAANLAAGTVAGTVEVLWNGEVVGEVTAYSGVYESHSLEIEGTGGNGELTFREVATNIDPAEDGLEYDTTGPIVTYHRSMEIGGEATDVSAFAPGQSNLYQVISGQLKVFDTQTSTYEEVGDHAGFNINAIGFNTQNDLIYGLAKGEGKDALGSDIEFADVIMIDAEGAVYRIGDGAEGDFVGDFDDAGNLWTFNSSLDRVSSIDVDNLDGDGNPVITHYDLPNDTFTGRIHDIAFNAADNSFYAVQYPATDGESGAVLRFDLDDISENGEPNITSIPITGTLFDGEMQVGMAKGAYGAVFLDADGNLYYGMNRGDHDLDGDANDQGAIYKVNMDWDNGSAYTEFVAESETTGSNDGASDPRASDAFAEVDTESTFLIRDPQLTSDAGGNDDLRGGEGNDEMHGGGGDDLLHGGQGDDILAGDSGDDKIFGNTGDDLIRGGTGDDKLFGGSGDDILQGGVGKDMIVGGQGDDILYGGAGNDKLVGGAGSDVLEGGAGDDHLWGGNWTEDGASDTFAYSPGGGKDMIHDFEPEHDQIDLSAYGLTYEDIAARMTNKGWATEIDLSDLESASAGDMLVLKSIDLDELDESNFIGSVRNSVSFL